MPADLHQGEHQTALTLIEMFWGKKVLLIPVWPAGAQKTVQARRLYTAAALGFE